MRFALQPLQVALGHPTHAVMAELTGVKRATVAAWTQRGLSVHQADRVAIAAGLHPSEVWDDWWDAVPSACGNDRCGELVLDRGFCSQRCRWATGRRAQRAAAKASADPQTPHETVAA